MGRSTFAATLLLAQQEADPGGLRWFADPRTTVLLVLASTILIGGGRRLWMASRARRAVERLGDPDVPPDALLDAAEFGRAGLIEFFRLLAEGKTPEVRTAAGRALATVWARDDLIPEEEKAVLIRGFDARWRARRRYPRAISSPIPVEVAYGLPFLEDDGPGVSPHDLEWSHRISGAERAALERPSDWRAGPGLASFAIDPRDFADGGPHRLILKARARTGGRLTSRWEAEPPHVPFAIEFDPKLSPDALYTLPDEGKGCAIAAATRLAEPISDEDDPRFLELTDAFVIRDPPVIRVLLPLPSDLAHRIEIELEGHPGRYPAGRVVVTERTLAGRPDGTIEFDLGPVEGMPADAIGRPGEHRLRAVLRPDTDLGWADPDVRSLWPGEVATDWHPVRVIRR